MVDYLTEIPFAGRRLASTPAIGSDPGAAAATTAFVAGSENRLVAATFDRLLDSARPAATNGEHDRPSAPSALALFGPSGTGKTHLAHGLVGYWQSMRGTAAAHYLTANDFRRQYILALRDDAVLEFRRQLREPELLALDDLHQLPSDEHLMQEMRYTLDEREDRGATVVVTSNRPPATLANLSPDVRSRLTSALLLQLAAPGPEARLRILRQASAALGQSLPDEAAERLAAGVSGPASQLIGALFELAAAPPTAAGGSAADAAQLVASRAARRPSLRTVVAVVAKHTRIPQKQLRSASRKQSIVFARSLVVYLARTLTAASYHEIGRALGGRDHTTIMHSFQKIDQDRMRHAATQDSIDELQRALADGHFE